MKTVFYSLFFLVIFLGLTELPFSPVNATSDRQLAQAASQNTFDDYRTQCLQQAQREGLSADIASDLCNCTIKKFRDRYTLQQFRDLVQKSKTNRDAAQALTQVGEACFEEVLYEE